MNPPLSPPGYDMNRRPIGECHLVLGFKCPISSSRWCLTTRSDKGGGDSSTSTRRIVLAATPLHLTIISPSPCALRPPESRVPNSPKVKWKSTSLKNNNNRINKKYEYTTNEEHSTSMVARSMCDENGTWLKWSFKALSTPMRQKHTFR